MPGCASDWLVLPMQSPSLEKAPGIATKNLPLKPHLGVSTSGTENMRNLAGSFRTSDFEISINGSMIRKVQRPPYGQPATLEVLVFGLCSLSFILDAPMDSHKMNE